MCSIGKDYVASGSFDNTVRIWTLDGQSKTILFHEYPVMSVCAFDSGIVATGSMGDEDSKDTVRIWDRERLLQSRV